MPACNVCNDCLSTKKPYHYSLEFWNIFVDVLDVVSLQHPAYCHLLRFHHILVYFAVLSVVLVIHFAAPT